MVPDSLKRHDVLGFTPLEMYCCGPVPSELPADGGAGSMGDAVDVWVRAATAGAGMPGTF